MWYGHITCQQMKERLQNICTHNCNCSNSNKWQQTVGFVSCAQVSEGRLKKKKKSPCGSTRNFMWAHVDPTYRYMFIGYGIFSSNNKYKSISKKEDTPCDEHK